MVEDDDLLLLDGKAPAERTQGPSASKAKLMQASATTSPSKRKAPARNVDDSETEEEEEEEVLLLDKAKQSTPAPTVKGKESLPTPARSVSPDVDPGRAPGRIIGNTYPLKDFKKNTAQGDLVSKAVQDLSAVIVDVVSKPFASRRHDEMIECMQILRKTSLEVCWFSFLGNIILSFAVDSGVLCCFLFIRKMKSIPGTSSFVN
jgi:ATP-dependent DNA helicase 2 subunit 2